MVNLPAGCAGCHKLGIDNNTCKGCGLRYCQGCTAGFGGACPNCGARLV
ncbi:MAG: hypothetical protein OK442_03525 [Thaumarchaeota archaeon]|nr:hypothetical protein [Nitrososphaerota archaeon]